MGTDEDRIFRALSMFADERTKENCVVIVNGRRFKPKNNMGVFDNEKQAKAAVKRYIDRYVTIPWGRYHIIDEWIEKYVVCISPEEYYRTKRKMREDGT